MMENYITSFQLRFCPAAYLHLEQLPSLWRSILPYLPQWRDSAHLNAALLDEFSLDTDYEEPHGLGALPLQPQSQLELLLFRLGLVLHGEAIRRCVLASPLQQLLTLVNQETLRQIIVQHELLIGPWPTHWQRPLPTEIESRTMIQSGLAFWLAAMEPQPQAWCKRLSLRLPLATPSEPWLVAESQRPLAQTLCHKLVKQVTPTCSHLFK
ncbi:preprotein translocase K [Yersinia pestis]|uniref:SctK family type III secretion system sorting platform protein YscK n=1 Tax=Yersinia pestis TaxID=632 RepID=UPI000BE722FE|nr:SctK family type III secretion system sorting platform protein YscK [Yersinia pestis]PDQ27292.1 preprotein translocase K [Yersinia pestis]